MMNTQCANTTGRRTFVRRDLGTVLPQLANRVRADAFGVDKSPASRWKSEALRRGLIDARSWHCLFLAARMNRALAA